MTRPHRLVLAIALVAATATACTTTYDFDPVTVGGEDHDREPRAKSSSQFIRSVYADLLGRTPEVFDFTVAYDGVPLAGTSTTTRRNVLPAAMSTLSPARKSSSLAG